MRYYTFNSHVDPVRTEMIVTQHIPILKVCYLDNNESKGIIADKNLSQVCSTDKSKSESAIVNEISTEEGESESVRKSINTNNEKDAIDKTKDEEPSVADNPVVDETIYFNLFKCGKNFLDKRDATC